MLAFPSAIKIYLAVQPVDMRKQFNEDAGRSEGVSPIFLR
jgi:hypothetical protein